MSKYSKFNGALASPYDERDYTISMLVPDIASAPALPNEFVLQRPHDIKNQGDISSCVAHALSTAKEIQEYYQNSAKMMSVGYIYGNRRGLSYTGEGMYPSEALYNLKKYGVCENSLFPYNKTYNELNKLRIQKQNILDNNAVLYKISAYAKLDSNSVIQIKQALINIGPVLACWMLYETFEGTTKNGIVKIPDKTKEMYLGSHAMLIIGYKKINSKDYWIVVNSWGEQWADKGICYIPVSYVPHEAWSITDNIYPAKQNKFKKLQFNLNLPDRVYLDDIPFTLNNNIQVINDRIYVPLRFVSEAFECTVTWMAQTKQIKINKEGNTIIFQINSNNVIVNNINRTIDDAPIIINSLTYIPLRALSDILKYKVEWNNITKTATINR